MTTSSEKRTVLIVDDDRNTRDGLGRALRTHYQILIAENGEHALDILGAHSVDVMMSDVRMPGMDGLTLLQRALAHNPQLICILLTAYGSVEVAVEAMKRGAYDFLMKPVNLDHLDILLKRALHSRDVETENTELRQQLDSKFGMEQIIGEAPAMQQLFDVIRQAAPTQATVLIQGESGTGKELVAHAIHRLSTRAKGPFIPVHCAALTPTLLESELFGHEKGAYTGAAYQRHGRFEMADGGTLFLDEISEIDLSSQVKLLRVLEERKFERVGGSANIEVDIRLIAATNRDLRSLIDVGKFREDLFFRLDVVNIRMPPLRERLADVPMLFSHFLGEFNRKNTRSIEGITPDALNILCGHSWPGNVRELRNTIEKMVVLSRGPKLTARDLPPSVRDTAQQALPANRSAMPVGVGSIAEAETLMIQAALTRNNNNRTKAAEALGISRRTLHRKLKDIEAIPEQETAP